MTDPIVPKILVMDDTPLVLDTLTRMLRETGAEVSGASNYSDGNRLLHENRPDVFVSDLNVEGPGGKDDADRMGLHAIGEGLRNDPNLVAIIMTGTGQGLSPDDFTLLLEQDISLLGKPFIRAQVLHAIDDGLARRSRALGSAPYITLARQ